MPRYFFHVQIGEDRIADPDGQVLPDADRAWEVARAMAHNLMNTPFDQPVNWASSHIEVTDAHDEIVLEFPFVEALTITQRPH